MKTKLAFNKLAVLITSTFFASSTFAVTCTEIATAHNTGNGGKLENTLVLDCQLANNKGSEKAFEVFTRLCVAEKLEDGKNKSLDLIWFEKTPAGDKQVWSKTIWSDKMKVEGDTHTLKKKDYTSTSGAPFPDYVGSFFYQAKNLSATNSNVEVKDGNGNLFKIDYTLDATYKCTREL